jgi:polar amino acid transport system substrate-binding protein
VKWLAAIVLLLFFLAPAPGQAQPESLRVATRIVKPFVFEEGGNLTGFSIELWQEISLLLGVRTDYIVKPSVRDLLDSTQSREADLAIAAISITEERERDWDFSLPMFDGGLQILIPRQGRGGGGIFRILGAIFSPEFLPALVFMVGGVVLAGLMAWLFERRRSDGVFTGRSYFAAIFDAIFWATSALATQAELWPKSWAARAVSAIWMFTAVVFIAFFTASVTSSLTVSQLRADRGQTISRGNGSRPSAAAPPPST